MSCDCQLLPALRVGIKWIYAKEAKKKKEKMKKIKVIRLVLKQCLLIQFLDDSSFDNINLLAVTNYDIKSKEGVKFLL